MVQFPNAKFEANIINVKWKIDVKNYQYGATTNMATTTWQDNGILSLIIRGIVYPIKFSTSDATIAYQNIKILSFQVIKESIDFT